MKAEMNIYYVDDPYWSKWKLFYWIYVHFLCLDDNGYPRVSQQNSKFSYTFIQSLACVEV